MTTDYGNRYTARVIIVKTKINGCKVIEPENDKDKRAVFEGRQEARNIGGGYE